MAIESASKLLPGPHMMSDALLYSHRYEEAAGIMEGYGVTSWGFLRLADIENVRGDYQAVFDLIEAYDQNPNRLLLDDSSLYRRLVLGKAYLSTDPDSAVAVYEEVLDNTYDFNYRMGALIPLAILYSDLDDLKNAQRVVTEIKSFVPHFSANVWGDREPMVDRAVIAARVASLEKVGL